MSKKSQGSLELLLILVFMFSVIILIMYIIGIKSLEIQNTQKQNELDDFANDIISEFNILSKVHGGYYREVEIPFHLIRKFNLTVNSSYLILRPIDWDGDAANEHFYFVPGGHQINLTTRLEGIINKTYLILSKTNLPDKSNYLEI